MSAAEVLQLDRRERLSRSGKPLRDSIVPLSREGLRRDFPPRRALLRDSRTGRPVMVRGKTGIVGGSGGAGKTMALTMLAICTALGRAWFGEGGFDATQGRVLMLLAEEDREEIERRIASISRAMGLDDHDLETLAANLVLLPLAGQGVAFTSGGDGARGELPETERPEEIRELLREAKDRGEGFVLVILDPLSRFAGFDVEKDNPAATRFVQVLESFTGGDCGEPNVLVAHHLRKIGQDEDREASQAIRGAVGLVDGVRFAAILSQQKVIEGAPDLLRFKVVKSNYAAIPDPLEICRPADAGGTLRVATLDEIEAYGLLKGGRGSKNTDLRSDVIELLTSESVSGTEIARRLKKGKGIILGVLAGLETDGLIQREGRVWSVRDRSNGSETDVSTGPVRVPPFKGNRTGTDFEETT